MTTDPKGPIFISYRQRDGTAVAAELASLLRTAGLPVWRDRDDLPPGDTESRLTQAISAGISGAVLVVTPDIVNSNVVKSVEAPRLLGLHHSQPEFALAIANAVETESRSTDYAAPDTLLGIEPGTLAGVDQHPTDRAGLLHIVRQLMWHRAANHRPRVTLTNTCELSVQTRNQPQSYDRTPSVFDIRVRPSDHERLPSTTGLTDLRDTIGFLPDAITRSAAQRVQIRGGAHLCVAVAVGAALPSTRIGHIDVIDQQGKFWASSGEARLSTPPHIYIESQGVGDAPIASRRRAVAVYLDLMKPSSDAAFERYLEDSRQRLSAWLHLRSTGGDLLDHSAAGAIAAEAAARIRTLANDHGNADVHLLLRCPFPIAILLGRLTNTLRVVAYEWDDGDQGRDDAGRPRYVPTLRIRASATAGAIEEVLLGPTEG
ncbi:SAVED domain-containing protein [Mycolicibacterium psychrotolerans]|uniref:SAVED domain-containing protein n=1 Tax=Mycolicibacterium psychrotolerans TaxID=216929 RepID=UPI003D66747D